MYKSVRTEERKLVKRLTSCILLWDGSHHYSCEFVIPQWTFCILCSSITVENLQIRISYSFDAKMQYQIERHAFFTDNMTSCKNFVDHFTTAFKRTSLESKYQSFSSIKNIRNDFVGWFRELACRYLLWCKE